MSSRTSASPPRPRQAVHVGVIGHRLNRIVPDRLSALPGECTQILHEILELARTIPDPLVYSPQPAILRVISALAEGADRLVAHAGLAVGAELQCPLPFHAADYANDFPEPSSKQEFADLLASATTVFELEGNRADEGHSYELAGRVVVAHSDLIVAIWNGEPANGRGGTAQMIEEALALGLPVVWLHATEPRPACVLERDEFGAQTQHPLSALKRLFSPTHPAPAAEACEEAKEEKPEPDHAPKGGFDLSHAYCAEHHPWLDGSRLYTAFRDLMVKGYIPWRSLVIRDFDTSATAEWTAAMPSNPALPPATRDFLMKRLCPYYAWADGLSTYYAGLFRSSSIATNMLSAFAVLFALLGLFTEPDAAGKHSHFERVPAITEFVLICCVLFITFFGRRRRWHERWLNYRQLAERIRQYFFLAPLGTAAPAPRALPHFGQDPTSSWVDGTFHAVVRDVGLVPAVVDREYLESIGALLNFLLADQAGYHAGNHRTMERLTERLHIAGTILFGTTLVTCILHMTGLIGEHHWVILLATVPPAFGAAFFGITNHGEFARSSDRSAAMQAVLSALRTRDLARALQSRTDLYEELSAVATRVAETMIAETLDWNAVFRYRPLNLPG